MKKILKKQLCDSGISTHRIKNLVARLAIRGLMLLAVLSLYLAAGCRMFNFD